MAGETVSKTDIADLLRRYPPRPAPVRRKRRASKPHPRTCPLPPPVPAPDGKELPPLYVPAAREEPFVDGSPEAQCARAEALALLSADPHCLRARDLAAIILGYLALEADYAKQRLLFPWPRVHWLMSQLRLSTRRNLAAHPEPEEQKAPDQITPVEGLRVASALPAA